MTAGCNQEEQKTNKLLDHLMLNVAQKHQKIQTVNIEVCQTGFLR